MPRVIGQPESLVGADSDSVDLRAKIVFKRRVHNEVDSIPF
jgi:hypothetical protein